jgi:hypothetical protein
LVRCTTVLFVVRLSVVGQHIYLTTWTTVGRRIGGGSFFG